MSKSNTPQIKKHATEGTIIIQDAALGKNYKCSYIMYVCYKNYVVSSFIINILSFLILEQFGNSDGCADSNLSSDQESIDTDILKSTNKDVPVVQFRTSELISNTDTSPMPHQRKRTFDDIFMGKR